MSKYRSIRAGNHASRREARRSQELTMLQQIGEISELREQVKYTLIPKQEGERAVTYTADFVYRDNEGREVVEDSKGFKTQQYVIRHSEEVNRRGIKIAELEEKLREGK